MALLERLNTAPEMMLLECLKTASLDRLECAWHRTWSTLGTALQTALQMVPELAPEGHLEQPCCVPWMTLLECLKQRQMAPLTGIASVTLVTGNDAQIETALGRHRSSRCCKEGTVPFFYTLRLVFILFSFYSFWWDELIEDKISKLILIKQWF